MILSQTPALLYHKVDTQREIGVTRISPKIFKQHMLTLKSAGWETILPGENNYYRLSSPPAIAGGDQGGVTSSDFKLSSTKTSCLIRKTPLYSSLLCRGDAHSNSPAGEKETSHPGPIADDKNISHPSPLAGGESKGGANHPKHFHLVFDDGYEGIYRHAFPILEEIGYKATVFIPSGFIGKAATWDYQFLGRPFRHMNQQILRDLSEAGWLIGSHGIGHIDLTGINNRILKQELVVSRDTLSEIIDDEVKWISFPFGRYGKREIEASIEAGYTGAVVPVMRKSAKALGELQIIIADAVYCWDPTGIISGRLERRKGYGAGRLFRMATNSCSYGTVIWKRLFTPNNRYESLAADE